MALKFQFHLSSSPASLSLPSLQKPLVHLPKTFTLVTPRKLCKTHRLAAVAPGVDPTNSQPLIKDEESVSMISRSLNLVQFHLEQSTSGIGISTNFYFIYC